MRIAIDIRWLRKEMDGIGRYVSNLVTHLVELDTRNTYFLITHPNSFPSSYSFPTSPRLYISASPYPFLSPRDFFCLPGFLNRLEIDLFHAPNYLTSPLSGRYAQIVTVHDLIPYLYPETLWKASLRWKFYYRSKYPAYLVLHKADQIIADSLHTKKDIVKLFGIPPEKIRVIWPGIETRFYTAEKPSKAFLQKYNLREDFLLYLGRQDPYKGLEFLIRAYYQLDPGLRNQYPLIIAGKKDSRYLKSVEHLIEDLALKEQVQFLGYVPDPDLPSLYKAATLFVYPSLYEGFGFPPLEAMACGTPVIYGRGSSLEEVIGDKGGSFTPHHLPELTQAIQMLLQNRQLREEMSQRGREQVLSLTWRKTAEAVLEVYQAVGHRKTGQGGIQR
ncbi:MAG TPA: glycosyltransferase family 1 protein [Candidatus Limnocylindrales bacterium]|nr:glycosyltransferase family 1 protein [Candidatus Limnocylindrales bacterium]